MSDTENRVLLSACMIVKNEQHTIERCLNSLRDVVDEMIVVDTGSTDDTISIARRYGARVYEFAWDNDFSHARNESLRHATGDWILVIDADEHLDDAKKQGLRAFLERTDAEGVFVTVKNYLGSLTHITKAMPIRVMRVFRRGHQYSGAIHEQIAASVQQSGKPIREFDLDLHHIGYTNEFVQQRSKSNRNTNLLATSLDDDPNNTFHRSNLVAEHVIAGNFIKAVELAEQTFRDISRLPKNEWPNYTPRIVMHWIASLWEVGEREAALELCELRILDFPWLTDLKKLYADMLAATGKWIEAERMLMECRAQGDTKQAFIEVTEGSGTYFAAMQLGTVWAWLGDDVVARKWYLQSFFENSVLESTILSIVPLLPPDSALLHDYIETKLTDRLAYWNYVESYATRGVPDAYEVIQRAEERFGVSEQTIRARMTLLLSEGTTALVDYVDRSFSEFASYLLGLHYLECEDLDAAKVALQRGGTRGDYIWKTHELLTNTTGSRWGIRVVVRDFVAMRAERLLYKWLPFANDLLDVWLFLKHSQLGHLLTKIEWSGSTIYECEQNAMRCFQQKRFDESEKWLQKAREFGSTVTQILIECDLALAKGDIARARKIAYQGKKQFPSSEAIKHASAIVHPKIDPLQLSGELAKMEKRGMVQ